MIKSNSKRVVQMNKMTFLEINTQPL